MGIDRRQFVSGLSAGLVLAPGFAQAASNDQTVFLSAAKVDGAYEAVLLDSLGKVRWSLMLPGRGHGGTFRPGNLECVVFARRPGTFALVMDRTTGHLKHTLTPPPDRHFYGHGCYSNDGRRLYTTENDFDGERGVIGLWDVADGYRRVGEFDSHGIGPHEVVLLPDDHTLAIANGGILTHPETGRQKLNIPEMASSIVLLDGRDGKVLAKHAPPPELHKLSLRHLSADHHGSVFAAAQYEGPAADRPPLLASLHQDGLRFHNAPQNISRAMKNYCGAISFDATGRAIAVSCPRGNLITYWRSDGSFVSAAALVDGCGVAPFARPGEFLATSGDGALRRITPVTFTPLTPTSARHIQWDNHIAAAQCSDHTAVAEPAEPT